MSFTTLDADIIGMIGKSTREKGFELPRAFTK
jgi:hypothetical protein